MTKNRLAYAIATAHDLKKSDVAKTLDNLAGAAAGPPGQLTLPAVWAPTRQASPMPTNKAGLAYAIATAHSLKKAAVSKTLDTLVMLALAEKNGCGKLTIPGLCAMPPPKKAKKTAKKKPLMTKSSLAYAIATAHGLKKPEVAKILGTMVEVAIKELRSVGEFTIPGLCTIQKHVKPATEAGEKEMFGKTVVLKAKPEKTVATARCAPELKKAVS